MEEWLGEFGLRESEEWFLEWPKVLGEDCHRFPRPGEKAQAEIDGAHLRHSNRRDI